MTDTDKELKSYVYVKLNPIEYFHCWPGAPLSEKYLRNLHRHQLYITVEVACTLDNNRNIEYHFFKKWLQREVEEYLQTAKEDTSCEIIASEIYNIIHLEWNTRDIKVTILEDGEVGAVVINRGTRK